MYPLHLLVLILSTFGVALAKKGPKFTKEDDQRGVVTLSAPTWVQVQKKMPAPQGAVSKPYGGPGHESWHFTFDHNRKKPYTSEQFTLTVYNKEGGGEWDQIRRTYYNETQVGEKNWPLPSVNTTKTCTFSVIKPLNDTVFLTIYTVKPWLVVDEYFREDIRANAADAVKTQCN